MKDSTPSTVSVLCFFTQVLDLVPLFKLEAKVITQRHNVLRRPLEENFHLADSQLIEKMPERILRAIYSFISSMYALRIDWGQSKWFMCNLVMRT